MTTVPPIKPNRTRIAPSIGIARVGNSLDPNGWFYGPEVPGVFDPPAGGFKDKNNAIKRQAARFRLYEIDEQGNTVRELSEKNGFKVQWKVQVANKKASWYCFMGKGDPGIDQKTHEWKKLGANTLRNPDIQPNLDPDLRQNLIIRSKEVTLNGRNAKPQELSGAIAINPENPSQKDTRYLGEAFTDDAGHLVVLAGRGDSRSLLDKDQPYPLIMNDFDSAGWVDDTCDGWVEAEVVSTNKGENVKFMKPTRARVIGTTPKFATMIYAPTTLYDIMEDIYARERRAKGDKRDWKDQVSWEDDIWPLLQRPPLLSWVNGQANGGHGPNGQGNFFEPGWQDYLSNDSAEKKKEYETYRRNVIGRMRLPITDVKADSARSGQAYPYFMPWLSGDGGRSTPGQPETFTSITELQYHRLTKWAEGNFTKTQRRPNKEIESYPAKLQPDLLTKASLEMTIGAPLYPGIEMSWNAELPSTYELNEPFTIKKTVEAGDLTRYLSLPWQSDFYMCRSYWWPSARPDAVVPEHEYELTVGSPVVHDNPENVAKLLTKREPWERGLRQNFTDVYADQPLFANTDMVQRWHELGFVQQIPVKQLDAQTSYLPIFVERERTFKPTPFAPTKQPTVLAQTSSAFSTSELPARPPQLPAPRRGGIFLPRPDSKENPIQTVESLREHLQTAMQVELSTIPLYLYGMYSVKTPSQYERDPRYYSPILDIIRSVVSEEMLHLSLAGNMLKAIGGTPVLYDPHKVPVYPMDMAGRQPALSLQLRKLTKKHIQTYIEVEKPEVDGAPPQADKYNSLGQFYDAIKQGFKYLVEDQKQDIFDKNADKYQFSPGMGYQPKVRDAGGSVVINDLESALEAIKIIVEQGEGEMKDHERQPFDDPSHAEKDHYDKFVDLQAGEYGKWEHYDVISNPDTFKYLRDFNNPQIYQVSVVFDAAYCFLLLTIEELWNVADPNFRRDLVLTNMFGVMKGVLAPLANFLVTQDIDSDGLKAGPAFGFYKFENKASALKALQIEMQNAINSYVDLNSETPDQVSVKNYGPQLEILLPIQQSIRNLIDLEQKKTLPIFGVTKIQPGAKTGGKKGWSLN